MISMENLNEAEKSLAKLRTVREILAGPDGEFVAKDEIVDMMIVCAIAQEPMVIFGEPGTAKSAIISHFCDLLGFEKKDYFKYLLTSFTEPDELLGVVDISAYMGNEEKSLKPKFTRWDEGSIHQAKIVFLDEVFRGNSAILNTLLSIINERIYYEAGEAKPANTQVVYGATNDAPTGHDLRAFYARFPIRVRSDQVFAAHPDELLEKGWALEVDELRRRGLPADQRAASNGRKVVCQPEDLNRCQTWLATYWGDPRYWGKSGSNLQLIKRAYLEIVQLMNASVEQFQIDDRKAIKLFKVILAHSMLHSGPENIPSLTDIWAVLRHTWQDPELARLAMENVSRWVSEVDSRYSTEQNFQTDGGPLPPLPAPLRFIPPKQERL